MKNFLIKIACFVFVCLLCYMGGRFHRPPIETTTVVVRDTIYQKSLIDSGKILAELRVKDSLSSQVGIIKGTLKHKNILVDSLYSEIDRMLDKQDIIAETKISVAEGNMDVNYFMRDRMFSWKWDPAKQIKEIEVIHVTVPIKAPPMWHERWYITLPLGLLAGYGLGRL